MPKILRPYLPTRIKFNLGQRKANCYINHKGTCKQEKIEIK